MYINCTMQLTTPHCHTEKRYESNGMNQIVERRLEFVKYSNSNFKISADKNNQSLAKLLIRPEYFFKEIKNKDQSYTKKNKKAGGQNIK